MKEIFEKIIKEKFWTSPTSNESSCGPGSTIEYTKNLREQLGPLIEKYNIKSIFDVPCGDYSWMSVTKLPESIKYIGGDIVEFMVAENRQKYPNIDFCVFDLTSDTIPTVDLLFCRDCLLHLTFVDIDKVFENISKSNVKYVLLSNWFEKTKNHVDITTGRHRFINFLEEPFNFGSPIDEIIDYIPKHPKRSMLLWPKSTFTEYVERKITPSS